MPAGFVLTGPGTKPSAIGPQARDAMKTGLSILAAWTLTCAASVALAADGFDGLDAGPKEGEKKAKTKKAARQAEGEKKDEKPSGPGAAVSFGDDVDALATKLELTDEQKEKFQKIKESREKALENYDKANEKKVAKAQETLQKLAGADQRDPRAADLRKQCDTFIKSVETNRQKLTDAHDGKMWALLKPEQRAKWNAPILTDEMTKEFGLLFLDATQEEKLQKLCEAQAKRLSVPLDPEKHASALDGIKMTVYKTILNKKQQGEYRQRKASEAKPKTTEGGGKRKR